MPEDIPWTWTELGEDSFEHREARRRLHDMREQKLYKQELDSRIIGFVWQGAPSLTDSLVEADLSDVAHLDEIAVEHRGVVPILALEWMGRGVAGRDGRFVLMDEQHEEEVELPWIWEQIFEAGLEKLAVALAEGRAEPAVLFDDGVFREDDLFHELAQLGGVALVDFAAAKLGMDVEAAQYVPKPGAKPIYEKPGSD